ncbi:NGG1p interacting factor 3 [Fistulina hepatica ATCC 64428]|uniref:NGG1p interacting factor 3 n=1 Tax=Fistulina hepatica ATCC 64428 TaxID=1128425 RepID=A0A0D7ABV9_9AGAR|nr:NGG1p interacting factor 3 [Fistulina hepatica ATCC 64428]
MDQIAPLRLAEKWDNVGLILEAFPTARSQNKHVLLTIDLTPSVFNEALVRDVSVVVSYHPPIFRGLKALTLSNSLQVSLLRAAQAGISVYSPHTSVDAVWSGVNDWLADGILGRPTIPEQAVASETVRAIQTSETEGTVGRIVTLPTPVDFGEIVRRVKSHLKLSTLQVGRPELLRPVQTVAICAGSGGTVLDGVDADVYFTGEMSHHEVLAAVAAGRYVVLCGHTNTERGYLPVLAQQLRHYLDNDAVVTVSDTDTHPLSLE